MEAKTQKRLIKYLKGKGCYVIKTKPGPGIPKGCPDIIFMLEGFWGAIEVKGFKNAPFSVLQPETLAKFNAWSFSRVIYPENYDSVISELDSIL